MRHSRPFQPRRTAHAPSNTSSSQPASSALAGSSGSSARPHGRRSPAPARTREEPDERAVRLLEWPRLQARLEELAACEPGQILVSEMRPSRDKAVVRRALRETSEARFFLRGARNLPFGAISDVRSALQRARIGSALDARDLNRVKRLLDASRRIRQVLTEAPDTEFQAAAWDSDGEKSEPFDAILQSRAELIEPQPAVEAAIDAAIDEASEEVKDSASLDLLRARRNIAQAAGSIQARLRSMLADPNIQPALQDAFVTIRDGRYCLPVKSEARGRVPGIVHDRSSGGGTVFIEPQSVIDLNNQLREWHSAEREAIEAVLKALSAQVGAVADAIETALDICAQLDFAFAKGRLSMAQDASPARVAEQSKYLLLQARHPLVESCVPNDISLGDGFDVLMITGPNTGGKTVVMKTLGLLVWMTMCGLHVPARDGSEVFLPRAIWADIGDEQSIEQSLSTFSSHMTNIISILEGAQPDDLAFFDEIGAGTDPDEGAALAKAILRNLQRRGVSVLCTTHYGELKHFSASAERFENASVEFDAQSLGPTYRLRIGVPGSSNALDISARLGMPPELIARARKYLGRDRVEAEAATVRLEETQRELESRAGDIEREKKEAEKLRREYERKLARLEVESERAQEAARKAANEIIARAEKEASEVLRELRTAARGGRESKETEVARGRLRSLRERMDAARAGQSAGQSPSPRTVAAHPSLGGQSQAGLDASPNRAERRAASQAEEGTRASEALAASWRKGDIVKVRSLGREAELLEEPKGRAEVTVRVGAIKLAVAVWDLETVRAPTGQAGSMGVMVRKGSGPGDELNLIGKNTGEALDELGKYLDDALLSNQKEIRIVHGRGSGILRNFVQRWLRDQRSVASFEFAPVQEGGDGATVAKLSSS